MAINQIKITLTINLKNIFSIMLINDGDTHRSSQVLDVKKMEMGHTNKGTHTDKREGQRKQVQEQLRPLEACGEDAAKRREGDSGHGQTGG